MHLTDTQRILCDELLCYGDLNRSERQRIRIWLLLDGGASYREAGRMVGCSSSVVHRAVQAYKARSLEGIGRPPSANARWRKRLPRLAQLAAADPPLTVEEVGAALGVSRSVAGEILLRYGYSKPDLRYGWHWDDARRPTVVGTESGRKELTR